MYKRISFNGDLSSFWIEKKEDCYVAYKTFRDALRGFPWMGMMLSLEQSGLRAVYNSD